MAALDARAAAGHGGGRLFEQRHASRSCHVQEPVLDSSKAGGVLACFDPSPLLILLVA
jgi:hypothetical protein